MEIGDLQFYEKTEDVGVATCQLPLIFIFYLEMLTGVSQNLSPTADLHLKFPRK